ncbi:MAG: hypothetical protein QG583_358 [Patescibacteria group bacterium]|jgi:peptidase E|nr:hypothetical protein [Patescibacteria group bacterium]
MSTKYILVGGYVQKAEDKGKAFCEELISGIDKKSIKILDCMFARPIEAWEETFEKDKIFFTKYIKNFELELAQIENFTEQVKNSDVIFIRGGHTDPLINILNKNQSWIKELEGKTLAGTSAGANVIVKYFYGLNSHVIKEGFGLTSAKVIVHWKSEEYNVNWDKSLEDLKNYKEELRVYALKEGEFMVINN